MPFSCSICGEESTRICARCTKDACNNHLCEKCLRCSDCCECEVTLSDTVYETVRTVHRAEPVPEPPAVEPEEEVPAIEEPPATEGEVPPEAPPPTPSE